MNKIILLALLATVALADNWSFSSGTGFSFDLSKPNNANNSYSYTYTTSTPSGSNSPSINFTGTGLASSPGIGSTVMLNKLFDKTNQLSVIYANNACIQNVATQVFVEILNCKNLETQNHDQVKAFICGVNLATAAQTLFQAQCGLIGFSWV